MFVGKTTSVLLIIGCMIVVACDSTESPPPPAFSFSGDWHGLSIGSSLIGKCCDFSFTATDNDGNISGAGWVGVPSSRIGSNFEYDVTVSGTFSSDRARLTLTGQGGGGSYNADLIDCIFDKCLEGIFHYGVYSDTLRMFKALD